MFFNLLKKVLSIVLCLIFTLSTWGCSNNSSTGQPNDGDSPSAIEYDKEWVNDYSRTRDLVSICNTRVVESYEYKNKANTGLLICNNDGTSYVKDFVAELDITFKNAVKLEYLLPLDKDFGHTKVWGITAFSIVSLEGEEVGYVGRMHFGGDGYLAGPTAGTGYVYDAETDKYMLSNERFTRIIDISKDITLELENGNKLAPFFDAQNTIPCRKILPNARDEMKGALLFEIEGNFLNVKATIYGEDELMTIGQISSKKIKDGFKILIKHFLPYKNESNGRGVYLGYAHSVLLLSINDISLAHSEI